MNIINSIAWTMRWCPGQEFMILDMMTNNNPKILETEHIIFGCGY